MSIDVSAIKDGQRKMFVPQVMAKAALEPQGRWDALREELVELYTNGNEAKDGTFRARAEYLLTVARLPA
jgi:hypothetical protein